MLGFESADHPLDAWLARALELCRDHGGSPAGSRACAGPSDEARASGAPRRARGATRSCRRRTCATRWWPAGILAETFETAITWDRFDEFVATGPQAAAVEALRRGRA